MEANSLNIAMREKLGGGSSLETFNETFSQNDIKNLNKLCQIMHHGTIYCYDLIIWKS